MTNVLQDIPYKDAGMGRRKLVDRDHLLLMQAALLPGQKVPHHQANSNVQLLVVKGMVVISLAGEKTEAREGDLVPVSPGTPMEIENNSSEKASFLIWKTPHPERIG